MKHHPIFCKNIRNARRPSVDAVVRSKNGKLIVVADALASFSKYLLNRLRQRLHLGNNFEINLGRNLTKDNQSFSIPSHAPNASAIV